MVSFISFSIMAVVCIQIGQCGNQIGNRLSRTILNDCTSARTSGHLDYESISLNRFFIEDSSRKKLTARAILIDMEHKVIQQCLEQSRSSFLQYDPKCVYSQTRGSGNNWGNGYCVHAPAMENSVLDMVQRQLEQCDRFGSFLVLMSVAGGTGSGVGTYVTELLQDNYSHCFVANQITWPYSSGEVIVQDYNTILTLSKLHSSSDAVLVISNDDMHKICSKLLNLKQISFGSINKVICHELASVLQPATKRGNSLSSPWSGARSFHFGDVISHLVAHPQYKLLSLASIPQVPEASQAFSSYTWPGLLKHLRQMLVTATALEEGLNWSATLPSETTRCPLYKTNRNLAVSLHLRGALAPQADVTSFTNPDLFSALSPTGEGLSTFCHPHKMNGYEKSGAVLYNGQGLVGLLDSLCTRVSQKYSTKAFLYQYLRYGLEEDTFIDALLETEHVLSSYQSL